MQTTDYASGAEKALAMRMKKVLFVGLVNINHKNFANTLKGGDAFAFRTIKT